MLYLENSMCVIYEINISYVNILLYVLYVQFWSPCCIPYINMCRFGPCMNV